MHFKIKKIILLFFSIIFFSGFQTKQHDAFPQPHGIKNMLFYVQRSLNKNTIIYELNVNGNEELDEKEPIKIYWINYEKSSDTEPLNYIQRKYAYGLTTTLLDAEKKSYYFNFVSYKKKFLYLIKSTSDKKYHVYYYMNSKLLIVNRIYIHIEGGSFWTPKVKYIEIFSKDPIKNEDLVEKIIV